MMRYVLTSHVGSIIETGGEFYVYHGRKLERVCPSEGMAREVFAGLTSPRKRWIKPDVRKLVAGSNEPADAATRLEEQ